VSLNVRLRNRWRFRGPGEDGRDRWDWEAFVDDGGSGDLERVTYVEYILHPTFPNPIRTILEPEGGFVLRTSGWGTFELRAYVQAKDGERVQLRHQVELAYNPHEGVSNGPGSLQPGPKRALP
jgi:transcription initiation factor IIF auxiliary subunit